jgi:hypothetical protein
MNQHRCQVLFLVIVILVVNLSCNLTSTANQVQSTAQNVKHLPTSTPQRTNTSTPTITPLTLDNLLKAKYANSDYILQISAEGNDVFIRSELSKQMENADQMQGLELLDAAYYPVYEFVYDTFLSYPEANQITIEIYLNNEPLYSVKVGSKQALALPYEAFPYQMEKTAANYILIGAGQQPATQWETLYLRPDLEEALASPTKKDVIFLLDQWILGDVVSAQLTNGTYRVSVDYNSLYQNYLKFPNPDPKLIRSSMENDYVVDALAIIYVFYRSIPNIKNVQIQMTFNGNVVRSVKASDEVINDLGGLQAVYTVIDRVEAGQKLLDKLK